MKTLIVLALLCALAPVVAARPHYAIPTDACKQIVEAFRQRDFAVLMPVLFDLDDDAVLDSLFRAREGVSENDFTEYTVSRSDLEEDYERNLMSLQRQFNLALATGDSLGIDWAAVNYDGFTVHGEDRWMGLKIFYDFEIALLLDGRLFWLNPGILRETPNGWKLAATHDCRFELR